jgi:hypothetical protein
VQTVGLIAKFVPVRQNKDSCKSNLGTVQPLADGGVEMFQRLPDMRLLQCLFTLVVPGRRSKVWRR